MRILSIITLCFILAASAYAGTRSDRGRADAKDKSAAAQSSPTPAPSAPAVTVAPSAPPPPAPAPAVHSPARSYQSSPAPARPTASYSPPPVSYQSPRAPVAVAQPSLTPMSGRQGRGDEQVERPAQHARERSQPAPQVVAPSPARGATPPSDTAYRPGRPADRTEHSAPGSTYQGNDRRPPSNEPGRASASVTPPPASSGNGYRPGQPSDRVEHKDSVGRSVPGSAYRGSDLRLQSNEPGKKPASSGDAYRPGERSDRVEHKGSVGSSMPGGTQRGQDSRSPRSEPEKKPVVVSNPRPEMPGRDSRPTGHTPDRRGQYKPDDKRGNGHSGPPSDGRRPDGKKVYSTGYSPNRTAYTVGYHRPTKFYVPKTYAPPAYRQGYYHYPAAYHARPCIYPYWAFEYAPGFSYRSVYFNFGVLPYVQISRITECSYTTVTYVSEPLYVSGGSYYINSRYDGLDQALADLRSAWISGRFDLIQKHVRAKTTIAVLLDGEYDYAISSEDYLYMTRDAIADLDTQSFIWDTVRERHDGTVTAFGQHSYSTSGNLHEVFVSYTFQKIGREYYLTEIGSSLDPLD